MMWNANPTYRVSHEVGIDGVCCGKCRARLCPQYPVAWCQLQAQTDRGEDAQKIFLFLNLYAFYISVGLYRVAVVFDQNSPVSGSFELIYRVLKKTKMFASIFTNVTVARSAGARLGDAQMYTQLY